MHTSRCYRGMDLGLWFPICVYLSHDVVFSANVVFQCDDQIKRGMDLKSELPLLTGQKVRKVEKDFPTYFGTTLGCKDPSLEKYSPNIS